MKKLTYLTLLCAVVIVGLLAPPVAAAEIAPGDLVPFAVFPGSQEFPDVDGDMVVWEDGRNGNKEIYFSNSPGTSGTRITNDPASQERPSISGNYIVWQDYRNGNWDIYLYKRSTDETTQLTNDTGKQWLPIVRGNYVAWYDSSSGDNNIVLYDIAAGSVKDVIECDAKTTIPGGSTEFKPALSEKYVAWVEEADERIRYYSIDDGEMKGAVSASTAIQSWPSLYGSVVAWEDNRHGNPDIYMTDLDNPSGGEQRITSDGSDQVSPVLTGQILAWEDKRDAPRIIYMYDRNNGEEMAVPTAGGEQLYPAASGNMIVWQKARDGYSDLYMFMYDPEGEPDVVTRIDVEPPTATMNVSDELKFNATCYDENDEVIPDLKVSWSYSNGTVGYVDSGGYFTAYEAGTTTVVASAGGITGAATVTVNADEPVEPVVTRIAIDPSTFTLDLNATKQFTATAFDQNDEEMTGVEFNWSCSDGTIGEIDDTGLFTAKAAGTAIVTASAEDRSATATVTVNADEPVEPVVTRIEIAPPTVTLDRNGTQQFSATAFDQFEEEMTGVNITWSCSDETVGEIDDTGLFTAHAAGTATVTATADGRSATATVTVMDEDPVATEIAVTPATATLDVEDIQKFIVTVYDQNGNVMPAGETAWSSSNGTVGTIDESSGIFTALAAGTTTVTGTADGLIGIATVTVDEWPLLAKIAVVPSAATLEVDDDLQFDAVAFDRFGNVVEDAGVSWECCDPCVGTIDPCSGVFTALDSGTVTITACGDGAEGTATVTVNCNDPVLTCIVVTPSAVTLARNDTAAFTATALDQDGCEMPDVEIDWCCSDDTVGEVDGTGFFAALAAGTATVTATADGVAGTAEIEVTDESTGIVVSPSSIILDVGETWQFNADVYDLQDNAGSIVSWSCDDEGVGTITADGGLFTAVCGGSTTVTATVAGENETATGTATVTVRSRAPELARIEVSPSDFCIPAGNSLVLTARGFDQYGLPMDVDVTWESSDLCIGEIDECGVFTALCDGEVQVTASADGVCGSACVTVDPSLPVPACIEVEPSETTLAPGGTREFTATVYDQCENEMDWVRVAWSCSDGDVGTIDRSGLFAAFSEGFTDVTACAAGVEETASVTVTAAPTTDPTPDPTPNPNNGGSTYRAYSDGGGDSGPSFFAGICENLKGGETHTFSGIDVTSIGSVAITASDNIPKLLMTVKETGCPNLAAPPGGSTYEYVEIAVSWANPNQVGGATLTFTIPAKWLEEHEMLPEDVRLMRYVNGGWQILETEVVDEENGLYRFRATTPGFSTFAIAAMPENVTVTAETNVTTEATATPEGTETMTTEPTVAATTTPAAPLVYAPFLAPLAFLLWGRKKN